MTDYYNVFEGCKNKDCKQEFEKDNQKNYDEEGYCMACSQIKSEVKRESSN